MNYSIIFKMVSLLMAVLGTAFSLCAVVAAAHSYNSADAESLPSWICIISLTFMIAFSLYLPTKNAPRRIFRKEALCVVGVGWILGALVGALPYIFIQQCGLADALFESASGISTTGASVFGDVESMPKSLLFWRALSQWIGGLGVVVFFVAVFSFMGSGAKLMYSYESSVSASGAIEAERIKSAILKIFLLYAGISAACLIVFRACGMGWFDGACHMMATVSTGGFSVYNDSIAHYSSALISWVVTFFMFVGGISFFALLALARGSVSKFASNLEMLAYAAILAAATLAVTAIGMGAGGCAEPDKWWNCLTDAAFQCVSIMTTTGFSSADYQKWTPATHMILFALMIVGGCACSTAGGLKVSRALAALKLLSRETEKVLRPRIVRAVRIDKKIFDSSDTTSLFAFVSLYAATALFGALAVAAAEPDMSFAGALSSAVSAISNVGPGLNEVGPMENYGFMTDASKTVLSILMLMGRVEFYSILILFMPSLWKKFQ